MVRGDGRPERVVQPLPLPQGVSDLAVGDGTAKLAMPASLGRFAARESAAGAIGTPARDEPENGGNCLEPAASAWRFPAAAGESTITVTLRVAAGATRVERVDARGALPPVAADRVVREGVRVASACLSGLSPGRWVVVLTVAADGRVVRVRVV